MRLDGRVAFITGAGSGVGAATARRMASEGAAVAVVGRTTSTVQAVAAAISGAGGRALAITADVTERSQIEAAVTQTVSAYGQLDILVANAAIQLHGHDQPLDRLPDDAWDATITTNLRGAYLTIQAGLQPMLRRDAGGSIIVVSSITALVAIAPQNPAYTASKGGLLALGRALAIEYAPRQIRVNVVCPGALEAPPDSERLDLAARSARIVPQIPLGRLGAFEDIAPMITFLASDDARYATGGVFVVDGGLTAR